ncbi:MAG: BamA/TamA family outer membrane protein [Inhella sp.]
MRRAFLAAALLLAAPAWALPKAVDIEAPSALASLLRTHLDLSQALQGRSPPTELEWARLCRLAPAQARALLETEGYFEAQVQLDCATGRMHIEPGEPARISELQLSGPEPEHERWQTWRAAFALPVGERFRQADWDSAKRNLLAQVRAQGHALARWERTEAEVDGRSVRLTLQLEPGPEILLGELRFEGLQRHREEELRELLGTLRPGRRYTEQRLLDAQTRLQRSGLFDGVWVELDGEELQEGNRLPVRIRVKEATRQQLALGLGWQTRSGAQASVEHLHRRFLDQPLRARSRAQLAQHAQLLELELSTHPGRLQQRWVGALRWQRNEEPDTTPYTLGSLRLGRVEETNRNDLSYGIELLSSRQGEGELAARSQALLGQAGAAWRRLDSISLPREGWLLVGQLGAGPARSRQQGQLEQGGLARAQARGQLYLPFGPASSGRSLALRLEAGQLWAPAALQAPESLAFRAGGDDSVRGYGPRSLGPQRLGTKGLEPVGGRVLWTASAEAQQALPASWFGGLGGFGGAVFVDAGQAAPSWRTAGTPGVGAGLGLRWRSPVGLLRVDLARAMSDQPQQAAGQWRLHLSVGIAL